MKNIHRIFFFVFLLSTFIYNSANSTDAKTENTKLLSQEDFELREKQRRKIFYSQEIFQERPDLFVQSLMQNNSRPFAIPIDGQTGRRPNSFTLYAEQVYRFLLQSRSPFSELCVKVHENGKVVHEEKIAIPLVSTLSWDQYLTDDGMISIPKTQLKDRFGMDLRLQIAKDSSGNFCVELSQKNAFSKYAYSISAGEIHLYECDIVEPLPWQLGALRKPALPALSKPLNKTGEVANYLKEEEKPKNRFHFELSELRHSPVLNAFVEEMKKDPLALAQYVYNEITLVDSYLYRKDGVFQAPRIHRSAETTFLEKQGSPWEQCMLLVYLLRQAGYEAAYAEGDPCSIPKDFVEKMLFTQIQGEGDVLLKYPWVRFFDGKQWHSLFPWMKEMQITEGHDLYRFMTDEYASAERFILRYLTNDKNILKHVRPDEPLGDDTAGVLFTRFVEEELRNNRLSLEDVGVHRNIIKKQFVSWEDFSSPSIQGNFRIHKNLMKLQELFAQMMVHIVSRENPKHSLSMPISPLDIDYKGYFIHFSTINENTHKFQFQKEGGMQFSFDINQGEHNLDITFFYNGGFGELKHTFTIAKGTHAALCFNFGGTSAKIASLLYEKFTNETTDEKKLNALLSFMGASYFDKCRRMEQTLANLHKVAPKSTISFGLAKLSPDLSGGPLRGHPNLKFPQVDMVNFTQEPVYKPIVSWHQDKVTADRQFTALVCADQSSNEHQILREVFQDPHAISTIKLLQLAHKEHEKKGLPGVGFFVLTSQRFGDAERTPEKLQSTLFSHIKDFKIQNVKTSAKGQWDQAGRLFGWQNGNIDQANQEKDYAYAYMTPGPIASQDGGASKPPSYKGMGTLGINPKINCALISGHVGNMNGGYGSRLSDTFSSNPIQKWQLVPMERGFVLHPTPLPATSHLRDLAKLPTSQKRMDAGVKNTNLQPRVDKVANPVEFLSTSSPFITGTTLWKADVRLGHKFYWDEVGDPVDVVTGAFYVDEVDLTLPGPFPLEIRRNYNSQNPLHGMFGCGWKLGLNPTLVEEDDKFYAAEEDGTVIVYKKNLKNSRWEVSFEENPDLRNFNKKGIGSTANPFHAYIEKDPQSNLVLYGSDGSKRVFEKNLLKKWINCAGSELIFSYNGKNQLSEIKSSNHSFITFEYHPDGKISSVSTNGQYVHYYYNSKNDLIQVKLPNDAVISYDYDESHRIVQERKPEGRILKNRYDEKGRVIEQSSPVGLENKMEISATFSYLEDEEKPQSIDEDDDDEYCITLVKDSYGATTTYKIFNKQIYKIIDPLGVVTLQSWFIDEFAWFDAETETIRAWKPGDLSNDRLETGSLSTGAFPRSLKSSTDKRGLTTYYLYGPRGNPIEIGMEGKDLTGKGDSHIAKKFVYNAQNLCIEERVADRKTITTYDRAFPFLPSRIEKYSGNTLLSFLDLKYNAQGRLEKEDCNGCVTLYEYDKYGFPNKITQVTGTDDPNVVTEYLYTAQGKCVQKTSADRVEINEYYVTGNRRKTEVRSLSNTILSSSYAEYDGNNLLTLEQGLHEQDICHFSYNPSGSIKESRKAINSEGQIAATLYQYDKNGNLIEEVNPLGNSTYREYDPLGRVTCITKEGLSTYFSYEAGGLLECVISPGFAKTEKRYTTNGLLKEEIYPDGTAHSITYDFFGRPVEETKNGITWEIHYDDALRQVIRTHQATGITEVQEFDANGNLIKSIDASGAIWEQTYDGLNRLTSKTAPTGEKTIWSYQGDRIICIAPNGEKTIERYEAGQVVQSETFDKQGKLIAESSFKYDPFQNMEHKSQGDVITTTWLNFLGLPVLVQQGNLVTSYEYDVCGNCISSKDGEGRETTQEFDVFGRVIRKTLPDGAVLTYVYDADSNLIEYKLPGTEKSESISWTASYDSMGRKSSEELQSAGEISQAWNYTYENGYLIAAQDPMGRIHEYLYDSQGRRIKEDVAGWERLYTYDQRGLLLTAEEIGRERSLVKRSYDQSGRLTSESIFLNYELIQEAHQAWSEEGRSLQIGNHRRDFYYQNGQLVHLTSGNVNLSYAYDLSGLLSQQMGPLAARTIEYNQSALPRLVQSKFLGKIYQETLGWNDSGKLSSHKENGQERKFTYTRRGHLHAAFAEAVFAGSPQATLQNEVYEFDFGSPGLGIRTAASTWKVSENSLDAFGKILVEEVKGYKTRTSYDAMGQVISSNGKNLSYDPWGRLTECSTSSYTWKASYDAFGRRIQTIYTPARGETIVTNSYYDPEKEFQEIGVQINNKTFWKMYGTNSCDAVIDENDSYVQLVHNALNNLTAVLYEGGIVWNFDIPSAYGPQGSPQPIEPTLVGFAKSLTWQSKSLDPTGLIWMGARYYDPVIGRFISPDPVSYPICLDLYAYAGGDPINYNDPDGRFDSPVFKPTEPSVIDTVNIRIEGLMQAGWGFVQVAGGGASVPATGLIGGLVALHGVDRFATGLLIAITGEYRDTGTVMAINRLGVPLETVRQMESLTGIASASKDLVMKAPGYIGLAIQATKQSREEGIKLLSFTYRNFRKNLKQLTQMNPPSDVHAHHILAQEHEKFFKGKGIDINNPKYGAWWPAKDHLQKAKEYNQKWAEFIDVHKEATAEQIMDFAQELMSEYK